MNITEFLRDSLIDVFDKQDAVMPTEALLPHVSQQHSFLGITTI